MSKVAIIPLLTIVFLFGCGSPEETNSNAPGKQYCLDKNFLSKIQVEQPKRLPVTEGISLTGSIEPNPDKVIHFVSLVSGIISSTYFSLGDKVTKGQVLAELKSTELSELQSRSSAIASQIKVAEKKLKSEQSMFDDGIVSEKDLMEAQSELTILKSERNKIIAHLNLFSASPEKGVFQIKSPTTGIITAKSISAGTQISAQGEPLFTVSDLSEVWVLVNIYATNVKNIEKGMGVKIKTISYPDEIFKGEISSIAQVLDADAKVVKARVVLQNSDQRLKPGMTVDVTALKQFHTEALTIPASAMIFDNNQNYVIVYNGDCALEIRAIEVLTKSNGVTFLAAGVQEHEKIISKNQLLIYEQIKNFQN